MEDQTVICSFQICIYQYFWGRLGIYESWYLYPVLGRKINNKKTQQLNSWKKLEVSAIKYVSSWCSMTYLLCRILFCISQASHSWQTQVVSGIQLTALCLACFWGTAGSTCAHGMVPPSQPGVWGQLWHCLKVTWDGALGWDPWFPEAELWSYLLPNWFCLFFCADASSFWREESSLARVLSVPWC